MHKTWRNEMELRVWSFKTWFGLLWDVLSVDSATYLRASRKLRIWKAFQPNGNYAPDLQKKEQNHTSRSFET